MYKQNPAHYTVHHNKVLVRKIHVIRNIIFLKNKKKLKCGVCWEMFMILFSLRAVAVSGIAVESRVLAHLMPSQWRCNTKMLVDEQKTSAFDISIDFYYRFAVFLCSTIFAICSHSICTWVVCTRCEKTLCQRESAITMHTSILHSNEW